MARSYTAKNTEIIVAKILDSGAFDPATKGDDVTYAEYFDQAITAAELGPAQVISDKKNELSVEPSEDDTETRLYYGSDSTGNQNSSTETTPNNDVDITLSGDATFGITMEELALDAQDDTHATMDDYKAFVLGSRSSDTMAMLVKIQRLINGVYYMKNYLIVEPVFKQIGGFSGSSDDPTLSVDYALLGNKGYIYVDSYNAATEPTYTNI